jgi:excisionase family DNA binding protein
MTSGQAMPVKSACYDCIYFDGAKARTCDAFPNRIPEPIWSGKVRHNREFPGDRGIRFKPKIASEFLSIYELAKLLNVNPKTIYRAVWSGKLPAYRIGKTWRIARGDIEHFRE